MGEKDITEKLLEDYNDVFSDIVNVLLFDGREVVKESSLSVSATRSQYKADDRRVHEQERDVSKWWMKRNVQIALYGIENQTGEDDLMPLRVISYDGSSYKRQIALNKPDVPVITLVLYYGEDHWTKPLNLKSYLKIPEELDPYVSDYYINVFEISWLSDEQVKMFKSDFRFVADFFVGKRKNPDYMPTDKSEIRHVDEVLKLLSAFTHDRMYEELITEKGTKREVRNMCEVAERLVNKGREEGIEQGIEQGRAEGQSALADAIIKIHSGATVEDLIKGGVDEKTAKLAWTCR